MSVENTAERQFWLKHIEPAILQADGIPLIGGAEAFPIRELLDHLKMVFRFQTAEVSLSAPRWMKLAELSKDLGAKAKVLAFCLPPLTGTAAWVMSAQDLAELMSALLQGPEHAVEMLGAEFQEGFYRFVMGSVMHLLAEIGYPHGASLRFSDEPLSDQEAFLSFDIAILLNGRHVHARLALSETLRRAWNQQFAAAPPTHLAEVAESVELDLALEVGRTALSPKEWKQVAVGDAVLLDHCSYDPKTAKGRLTLTLQGRALFRGKLKGGELQLRDYPFTIEDTTMTPNDEEQHEEPLEEQPLPEQGAEGVHAEDEHEAEPLASSVEKQPISVDEVPVTLVVEAGRVRMSVKKLLDLQPGNLLQIDAQPEQSVSLVVNGRAVGRGELVKAGDLIVVRVTQLG